MRLLLSPGVDRAAVDGVALAQGWRLATVLAPTESRARRIVFVSAAGTELITYVEEREARYVTIDAHDPSPIAEIVRASLPCLDPSDSVPGAPDPGALPSQPPPSLSLSALPALPERPRLSDGVLARMHVAEGAPKVILTDFQTATVLEIDLASWRGLQAADGTRDLDALCLALAREGLYRGEADLVQLLNELSAAGVLTDGVPVPTRAPPVSAPPTPLDRELDVLPGFSLVCDGSGSCCRFYGSVAFGPSDAARAIPIAEEARLPIAARDLFTPASGAQLDEDDVRTVAQIDGRCAFLEDDGKCMIHRRAGAAAKPFPCSFYPAMLMDDGEAVRVSLGPECACIFASAGRSDGAPLVPVDARTLGDLGPEVSAMQVPDPVPLSARRTAPRSDLSRWSRALTAALAHRDADALALAWTLAEGMAEHGLDLGALDRSLASPRLPPASAIAPWMSSLSEHAERAASTAESWRGGSDLSRRVARWIADAVCVADVPALLATASDPASERFYLRALAHGHRLALEGRTLEHGLFDRATRVLAARAMTAIAPPPDATARYPLALLEAAMRNLGLSRYADSIAP